MSIKRPGPADNGDRPPKRPKPERQAPVIEEINFARQLQQFLVFRQDGIQELRNGIASFKAFLETILYRKDDENRARQLSILREYLETQKPPDENAIERPFLAQLWQAWSFGSQNHDDYLVSSVSSILALLLKTLSSILDFRDQGLLLSRTVIQNQHLRLIKRALDAPKHKEFLISPSLRLLSEVTSFDGGTLAREVYKRREQTFDITTLRRILSLVKTDITDEEARRRPSLRTQALRYVLQHLRYLHEGGRIDILKNRGLCSSLFQYLRDDPADLILDLLNTLEQSILKDKELPRSTKTAVLTVQNLEKITEIATKAEGPEPHPVSHAAYTWLHSVCTNPAYGALRPHGWYPPGAEGGTNPLAASDLVPAVELPVASSDGGRAFNVRNTILMSWILTLRPHANPRERELFNAALDAAPELVAAYVAEKSIQMDPKLSNTWIGLASMLFDMVRLPVPKFLGHGNGWSSSPPSAAIVIENILPRPLTQKILVRCLNQSSNLVKLFAIRILVLAFQKLQSVLRQLLSRSDSENARLWTESSELLLQTFTDRCPKLKDVISCFRQIPDDDDCALQREAITRLLRLFYEVNPLQALDEQFDVSSPLTAALLRTQASRYNEGASDVKELRALELGNLLVIAENSPGVRWFHKGSLKFSPLVTLMQIFRTDRTSIEIRKLITKVLSDHGICSSGDCDRNSVTTTDALLASVLNLADEDVTWGHIDDCLERASKKPVKYVDDLEAIGKALAASKGDAELPSILTAVALEQAPFVLKEKGTARAAKESWTRLYLDLLTQTADDGPILQQLTCEVYKILGGAKLKQTPMQGPSLLDLLPPSRHIEPLTHSSDDRKEDINMATIFKAPPPEATNHPQLFRWSQKDIDLAIEDGDINALILCLCSQQIDVRRQAFTQLLKARAQIQGNASLDNSGQLSLVLGELCETFDAQYFASDKPLPYITGCFAVRAFAVQSQPAADIYPKLNKFLIRGPEWRSSRMPSYWLSNTIHSMPEEDDAYWREIRWVLEWLVDGLRTHQDHEILRRGSVFEKVMALAQSPGAAAHPFVKDNVLQLLFRATCVEGGALSLVTRAGVLTWIDMMKLTGSDLDILGRLRLHVVEACDPQRLEDWMAGRKASAPLLATG